jgi:hypothetical protein
MLQVAAAGLPDEEQERIARLVYSYIVRRSVCDLTNKNLNKLFQAVSQRFFEEGPSLETLRTFFVSRSGESSGAFAGRSPFSRWSQEGEKRSIKAPLQPHRVHFPSTIM